VGTFIGFIILGSAVVGIVAAIDAATRPRSAFQRARQSKPLWVLLPFFAFLVFFIGAAVAAFIWFRFVRPKVATAIRSDVLESGRGSATSDHREEPTNAVPASVKRRAMSPRRWVVVLCLGTAIVVALAVTYQVTNSMWNYDHPCDKGPHSLLMDITGACSGGGG
jgi:hypothetical protein